MSSSVADDKKRKFIDNAQGGTPAPDEKKIKIEASSNMNITTGIDEADTEMVDAQKSNEVTTLGATVAAASSTSSNTTSIHQLSVRPITISFATVMSDLCMSIMFAYLTRGERCDCSAVAKLWSGSVRHPTTWRDEYFTHKMAESAPSWLRACIGRIDFTKAELTALLGELTQVRRLRIGEVNENSKTMTTREMRSTLRQLKKLDELCLYQVQAPDIWSALFQREDTAAVSGGSDTPFSATVTADNDPAIWSWESTLKTIWIAYWTLNPNYPTPSFKSMFESLSQRVWPKVESFTLNIGGEHSVDTMNAFSHLLNSRCFPALTEMRLNFIDQSEGPDGEYHDILVETLAKVMRADLPLLKSFDGRFASRNELLIIPAAVNWPSLTSLDVDEIDESFEVSRLPQMKKLHINRDVLGSAIALFQLLGHHSMPQLESLILPLAMVKDGTIGGVTEADSQIIRCIMSEMKSLTKLQVIFEDWDDVTTFSWVNQIGVLPSLTELELNRASGFGQPIPDVSSLPQAIGALSTLKQFVLQTSDILSVSSLLRLTTIWAARAAECVIEKLSIEIAARSESDHEEETSLYALVKNLAPFLHLTNLCIIRHPARRANPPVIVQRRTISDAAIATSYLSQLSALRKLKSLHIDDYHYGITPAVLSEWAFSVSSITCFPHLTMLGLGLAQSTSGAGEIASLLDRFPQLDYVNLLTRDFPVTPESEVFPDKLKAFIQQRNDEGRRPRIKLLIWLGKY